MNAGLLLTALSLIGDDPDRVNQIRKIIVALAISGKLDSRLVSLHPAKIMESVDRVKAVLAKQGSLPKQKQYAPITQLDIPDAFSDPSLFAPLGELARIEKGKTGIQQAQPGSFPLVVTAAERASCDHFDFDGAAAIIPLVSSTGHGNASLNRLHYQEGQFALGTVLAGVFPHDPSLISARFLFEYLSAFKDELLVSRMTGTANVTLTIGGIAEVPIPLVCPEVQKRVDELMGLCDRLETARAEREATRDRLTASSLSRINAPDPETFRDDASFVLNALAALTTRSDQIKQLRQAILNLAVRGKLVPQDPSDMPAEELLKRISSEALDQSDLPNAWRRARVGTFLNFQYGKGLSATERSGSGPVPVFGSNGIVGYTEKPLAVGPSIIVGRKGSAGALNFCDGPSWITDVAYFVETPSFVSIRFLLYSFAWMDLGKLGKGVKPGLSRSDVYEQIMCIPPLAEQHRIVAKVDELMALCDQLEASLKETVATRSVLLDSLLAEALEPV